MGTLFDQKPRKIEINLFDTVEDVKVIAKALFGEVDHTPDQIVAAASVLRESTAYATFKLALQSADVLDEQLAGFGEIALRITGRE